jgi:hypothetical protein
MHDMLADVIELDRPDFGIMEEQAVDGDLRWRGNGNVAILAVLRVRQSPALSLPRNQGRAPT